MRKPCLLLFFFLFCFCGIEAQVSDYRDAFLGLYHSTNTCCWNSAIQSPFPNVYILVEKSPTSADSIIITDTLQYANPRLYAKLNNDSTWVSSGAFYGHFKNQDSIHCTSVFPGPYWVNHDGKRISPIAVKEPGIAAKYWYLFPNPANSTVNVVLPGTAEDLLLRITDLNGKDVFCKEFRNSLVIDTEAMPRGVYLVRITGSALNLNKCLVLID